MSTEICGLTFVLYCAGGGIPAPFNSLYPLLSLVKTIATSVYIVNIVCKYLFRSFGDQCDGSLSRATNFAVNYGTG